jgi:23S rRNA pseudouridine1911/1915/1917 synthase
LYVVDKPSGLPVHPTSRYLAGTVVGRLREQLGHGFASPVHRLDRETSGILLCARTRTMAAALTRLFLNHAVHKQYVAICRGTPRHSQFSVQAPITMGSPVVRIGVHIDPSGGGKAARTDFTLQDVVHHGGQDYSIWHAVPHTGRRHQIRVHLMQAGYPIVGDKIYGGDPNLYVRFCERSLSSADWQRLMLPRQALHASRLQFAHPFSQQHMTFEAPLPADLQAFLNAGPGPHLAGRCR